MSQKGGTATATTRWPSLLLRAACAFYLSTLVWLVVWVLPPSLLPGWSPVVITSGSMSPLIKAGDVVVSGGAEADLRSGRVVTFVDPARPERLVTHRIVARNADGTYQTRGDASRWADSTPVARDQITGVGRLRVPLIGLPVTWLQAGRWLPLVAWLAVTATAVGVVFGSREERSSAAPKPPRRRSAGVRRPAGVRRRRATTVATVAAVALLSGVSAPVPTAEAAWYGRTDNLANDMSADVLQPPTNVTGKHTCTILLGLLTDFYVDVSWQASTSSYAEGYEVFRATSPDGPYSLIGTVTGRTTTTFRDTTVQASTTYYYRVRSYAGTWRSGNSNTVSLTTKSSLCT